MCLHKILVATVCNLLCELCPYSAACLNRTGSSDYSCCVHAYMYVGESVTSTTIEGCSSL